MWFVIDFLIWVIGGFARLPRSEMSYSWFCETVLHTIGFWLQEGWWKLLHLHNDRKIRKELGKDMKDIETGKVIEADA